MGTVGTNIVKLDVKKLLTELNKALADEWLAYYQYWVGAKVVKGLMKDALIAELNQHAADELRHAGMLANRIIQLKGTPLLDPKQWLAETVCGYSAPVKFDVMPVLEQNIKGEQCAIKVYQKLLEETKDKDVVTYNMLLQILADEVEHEEDLENLKEDLESK